MKVSACIVEHLLDWPYLEPAGPKPGRRKPTMSLFEQGNDDD